MRRASDKIIRMSIVATAIVAWLSISNHCAIGGLIGPKTQSSVTIMHCHNNQTSPSKKSGNEEEMPCCKILRATITDAAKLVQATNKNLLPIQSWIVAEIIFADEAVLHLTSQELDTGPPFAASFTESVLQRSILAHAPPVSLS